MTTPVATIDATGIHQPTLADCLDYFVQGAQNIFGTDIYIASDSQDGELLGLFASGLNDVNTAIVQTYNAFSPVTAQGVGLSSVVKVNGIQREIPSYSTCDITLGGQVGIQFVNCAAQDQAGNLWTIPDGTVIPPSSFVTVTATCQTLGAVEAPVGWINQIGTPIVGWQTVTNTSAAATGAPVEDDAALRQRQSISTEVPASSGFASILGAVAAIQGVVAVNGIENDQPVANDLGIPANSIAIIVDGGPDGTIAQTIAARKLGCGTYGSTATTVTSPYGVPQTINWSRPGKPPITWNVGIHPLNGYTTDTLAVIAKSISDWTNGLGIDVDVDVTQAAIAAYLGKSTPQNYQVKWIYAARDGANPQPVDVLINYNERAFCDPSYVTFRLI